MSYEYESWSVSCESWSVSYEYESWSVSYEYESWSVSCESWSVSYEYESWSVRTRWRLLSDSSGTPGQVWGGIRPEGLLGEKAIPAACLWAWPGLLGPPRVWAGRGAGMSNGRDEEAVPESAQS